MKLTWTFYPKGQPSVTLTVVYVPGLDGPGLDGPGLDGPGLDGPGLDGPGLDGPGLDRKNTPGYLEVDTNTAYVNWSAFRVFNSDDQPAKRALFGSLTRVDTFVNSAESSS
ncbi:hypothetical protein [Spirosoma sp. KUDC1026]|uniref:hypothetical protein n=1 Tax=Spirosoma sp. KUDC1026 TaxID=2745947 RepID=UPI00159B93EB|nr:hypothetical protein [Spirosoma sp. KUDC1026]QKZ13913.1 hypothetical protein HU175_15240 [Spirosoma sp. KUDC1026]